MFLYFYEQLERLLGISSSCCWQLKVAVSLSQAEPGTASATRGRAGLGRRSKSSEVLYASIGQWRGAEGVDGMSTLHPQLGAPSASCGDGLCPRSPLQQWENEAQQKVPGMLQAGAGLWRTHAAAISAMLSGC